MDQSCSEKRGPAAADNEFGWNFKMKGRHNEGLKVNLGLRIADCFERI